MFTKGKYYLVGVIGEGTYGLVYMANRLRKDGTVNSEHTLAIKTIKKSKTESERANITSISTLREVKLLRELHHDNIVNMSEVLIDAKEGELALVFDYATWTMRSIMDIHQSNRKKIPEYTIKSMIWQTIRGLQFLHENWVIHRDIKPQNILVMGGSGPKRGLVQIADLGLARIYQSPWKPLGKVDKTVVTLWYRSPELLLGAYHYTPAVDVWSTGCMFAELCLAHVPKMRALFAGELMQKPNENKAIPPFETDQCHKIFEMLGFPNENLWPEVKHLPKYKELQALAKKHKYPSSSQLKQRVPLGQHISGGTRASQQQKVTLGHDLLSKMLDMNPKKRITAAGALSHRYFTEQYPEPGLRSLDQKGGPKLDYPKLAPKPLAAPISRKQDRMIEGMKRSFQQHRSKRQRV